MTSSLYSEKLNQIFDKKKFKVILNLYKRSLKKYNLINESIFESQASNIADYFTIFVKRLMAAILVSIQRKTD